MEIREGQFWRRRASFFVWEVLAVNPNDTIVMRLFNNPPEYESFHKEKFLEYFTPYDCQG